MIFLVDHNLERHAIILSGSISNQGWLDWISIRFVTLEEMSLSVKSDDRVIWQFAQSNQMILLTANRRMKGKNSLEQVLREENTATSLPVITLGDAGWLLGKPVTLTELKPSELSLDPIRADALILLESDESVLHLEFPTRPKRDIPFRMLDYRVRVYRRYPDKTMRQVVMYLQPTGSDLVRQTSFSMERTRHEFNVVCLWEQPAALFLQYPGLIPFATLGQTPDPEATLRQVAQIINQISDPTAQANLIAASAILAGIRLEEEVTYRLLRRDIMQESVIYRSIQEEAQKQEKRAISLNFLRDGLSVEAVARGTGLSVEEVQQLQQQMDEPSQN